MARQVMKNPLYKAIVNSVIGKFSVYFFQFFALAIYARIFSPEDFGVIATIQVFVVFFQLFSDMGIGPAIISRDSFNKRERDGIFTVSIILGLVIAVVFYLFSFILNYFYPDISYQDICSMICVAIFFNTISIVPVTALNKDTRFILIAVVDSVIELITLSIVTFLHNMGIGILALAARPSIQSCLRFTIMWIVSVNTSIGRASINGEFYHVKKILSFSVYQFLFNFVNYFSRNLDNILIGKFIGFSSLGVYDKAYQLMRYPLMLTTFALNPAIQPILTKHREDIGYILKEHNKLTCRILSLSIVIGVFIKSNADNIVYFMFGHQWEQVIPIIGIFCYIIPVQSVLSSSGAFFQVMNKTKYMFYSGLLSSLITIFLVSYSIGFGSIEMTARFVVFSILINFLITYCFLFFKVFKFGFVSFFLSLIKTGFLFTPLALFYCFFKDALLSDSLSPLVELVFSFVFIALLSLLYLLAYKYMNRKKLVRKLNFYI